MQSFLFIFSKLKPVPKLVPIYSESLELSKGSWKKKEPSKSKFTVISLSTSCQTTLRRFEQNSMNTCSNHCTQHITTQANITDVTQGHNWHIYILYEIQYT